jgi:hypothetical protein
MTVRSALVVTIWCTACELSGRPAATNQEFTYCAVGSDTACLVYDPTVSQLLARPELYHNKQVQTIGFLHLEFEGNGLFASSEDAEHVFGSGIWVEVPDSLSRRGADVNDQFVIIQGIFHGGRGGHMGSSKGTLDSITRLDRWPSRSEIRRDLQHVSPLP